MRMLDEDELVVEQMALGPHKVDADTVLPFGPLVQCIEVSARRNVRILVSPGRHHVDFHVIDGLPASQRKDAVVEPPKTESISEEQHPASRGMPGAGQAAFSLGAQLGHGKLATSASV